MSLLLTCFALMVVPASAWTTPTIRLDGAHSSVARQGDTVLFSTPSRREWFSGVAAGTLGGALIGTATRPTDSAFAEPGATATKPPKLAKSKALCDASVSTWQNPTTGRTVYLLGTAHISSSSAILAGTLVNDVHPDAVFVELDAKRVVGGRYGLNQDGSLTGTDGQVLIGPEPTSYDEVNTDTSSVKETPKKKSNPFDLRQQALQVGSAAVGGAIKGVYSKMDSAGFESGQEFSVAVQEGQKVGSKIVLGDRDVEETLRRLTQALAETDLKVLLAPDSELEETMKQLMPNENDALLDPASENFKDEAFRQEFSSYVETMKAKDNVKLLMGELKRVAPRLYTAMVAERDFYMANGLDALNQFPEIVAVMGIAHVDGVEATLQGRGWKAISPKCPRRS